MNNIGRSALHRSANALYRAYRLFRPVLGPHVCRFHPTCSEYGFESFKRHGIIRGTWLGVKRVLKCHPWHPGGYDPVPRSPSNDISEAEPTR